MEQFKEIVFNQIVLSRNSSSDNGTVVSNLSISTPIVVGTVSPDGTQISGYGNISNFNSTKVDGNTVFDIASISKTFVGIILADMVNQGFGQPK
jgi:serine-type D-Ala-D-Ala carboxypeptidase/endopeptidase